MTSPAAMIANSVNPLLVICLLAAPFRPPRIPARRFWTRCALAICVAVLLAEAGKQWLIWPGKPTFPSGHETFALAAATLLLGRDARWAAVTLPLVVILAWALVAAHYHQPVDVAGAFLIGPPVALATQRLTRPRAPFHEKS